MNNNREKLPALWLCILLDIIGMLSFSIPFVGEFSDVIWAPLSGLLYMKLFGGKMGMYGGIFSMVEEFLPGTDIIPTFTISYFMKKRELRKQHPNPQVIVIK